jgi:hypothetical protein
MQLRIRGWSLIVLIGSQDVSILDRLEGYVVGRALTSHEDTVGVVPASTNILSDLGVHYVAQQPRHGYRIFT